MLDKDVLGQALYEARNQFDNLSNDAIIAQFGSLEDFRLAVCKSDAKVIIEHFTANAKLTIPGLGLVAGTNAVTGTSVTGTLS